MSKGRTLDYIGSNINRASRLCDMARSFGIVIDAEDFSEMKKKRFSRMLSVKGLFIRAEGLIPRRLRRNEGYESRLHPPYENNIPRSSRRGC